VKHTVVTDPLQRTHQSQQTGISHRTSPLEVDFINPNRLLLR